MASSSSIQPLLFVIPLVALALLVRLRRMAKARPLKLEMLWITPVIFTGLAALTLSQYPPTGFDIVWLLVALALGGVLGWYRGRAMTITVDPETHVLNQQASPWAMLFLIALIAVRVGLRTMLIGEASALHLSVALITDAFMALAVGLFGVQRLEMWLRGRRLLAEAKASRAPQAEPTPRGDPRD